MRRDVNRASKLVVRFSLHSFRVSIEREAYLFVGLLWYIKREELLLILEYWMPKFTTRHPPFQAPFYAVQPMRILHFCT